MKLFLSIALIFLFVSPKIYGQEIELNSEADVKLYLMNEKVEKGSSVQHTADEVSLNTGDFVSVQVYRNTDAPYPDYSYGLLFRLSPAGTDKLDNLSKKNPGQYLVLRSHGHTFNSNRLGNKFSGQWLLWNASLRKLIAEKWLNHITGKKLLPDPFREK